MKIPYEKPAMAIERYALTQSIASCAVKIGMQTSQCVKDDTDAPDDMKNLAWEGYFVDEGINCDKAATSGTYEDGVCYHTATSLTFSS